MPEQSNRLLAGGIGERAASVRAGFDRVVIVHVPGLADQAVDWEIAPKLMAQSLVSPDEFDDTWVDWKRGKQVVPPGLQRLSSPSHNYCRIRASPAPGR